MTCTLSAWIMSAWLSAAAEPQPAARALLLPARARVGGAAGARVVTRNLAWDGAATALIICDMWDVHWCQGATARVAELAPRVNAFAEAARARGVLVIHAPSDTMAAYADHPARRRAARATAAAPAPESMRAWCPSIPSEDGAVWPIDQSDGGCDCVPPCPEGRPGAGRSPRSASRPRMRSPTRASRSGTCCARAASPTRSWPASTPTCASPAGRSACAPSRPRD